jgi:hypothetical protein
MKVGGILITDMLLSLLLVYFLLMNVTVERFYCHGKLVHGDSRFLVKETIDFCRDNNPLFLQRPEWLAKATCLSAYVLSLGYLFLLYVVSSNGWKKFAVPLLLFLGAKAYAIGFYHLMEFTSDLPPKNLIPYFSVEGPYILSMAIVLSKVVYALNGKEGVVKKEK